MISTTVKTVCLLNTLLLCASALGAELKSPISLRAGKIIEVKVPERILWVEEDQEDLEPVVKQASKKKSLLVLKLQLSEGASLGLLDYTLKSENEEFRCLAMAVEGEPFYSKTWQIQDFKNDQGQNYRKKFYLNFLKSNKKKKGCIELKSFSLAKLVFEIPANSSGTTLTLKAQFLDASQEKRFGDSFTITVP